MKIEHIEDEEVEHSSLRKIYLGSQDFPVSKFNVFILCLILGVEVGPILERILLRKRRGGS